MVFYHVLALAVILARNYRVLTAFPSFEVTLLQEFLQRLRPESAPGGPPRRQSRGAEGQPAAEGGGAPQAAPARRRLPEGQGLRPPRLLAGAWARAGRAPAGPRRRLAGRARDLMAAAHGVAESAGEKVRWDEETGWSAAALLESDVFLTRSAQSPMTFPPPGKRFGAA